MSFAAELESTARALLAPGKGLLAADESFPTIGKRFNALDIPFTEENRAADREMLFTTLGLSEFISGVILFDETIRQQRKALALFAALSQEAGLVPIFLSGGQSDVAATERLNAISAAGAAPWTLTFSYGRPLQDATLKTWRGSTVNAPRAQAALFHRAKCNGLAAQSKYSVDLESVVR